MIIVINLDAIEKRSKEWFQTKIRRRDCQTNLYKRTARVDFEENIFLFKKDFVV